MWRNVLASIALLVPSFGSAHAIDVPMVTVGDAGNRPDTTGLGAVAYEYRIGKFEVTNVEYAAYLNAVAKDDPNGLWEPQMGMLTQNGSIRRTGEPGSFSYSIVDRYEGRAVAGIDIVRAARFANWLHNGQPVGPQGPATTEDGAYTLTPESIANNSWTRNPGARYFLPTIDEWYKAAYYKGGRLDAGYWLYPTQGDEPPVAEGHPGGSNSAHYGGGSVAPVGGYVDSDGPYGTFDQAGNLEEWTETVIGIQSDYRVLLGGVYGNQTPERFASSFAIQPSVWYATPPFMFRPSHGFRIASVPEPGSMTLLLIAVGLAIFKLRCGRSIR